jgi:hypothetical protein
MAVQKDRETLSEEYKEYIQKVKADWFPSNKPKINGLYELMSADQHKQVENFRKRWADYITPLAEAWWKKHGYGCVWPEDDSDPMQIYKLEEA